MQEMNRDRRNKTIRFSASGQVYAQRIISKLLKVEEQVISQLSHKQRQEIVDLVRKLETGLRDSINTQENTDGKHP